MVLETQLKSQFREYFLGAGWLFLHENAGSTMQEWHLDSLGGAYFTPPLVKSARARAQRRRRIRRCRKPHAIDGLGWSYPLMKLSDGCLQF